MNDVIGVAKRQGLNCYERVVMGPCVDVNLHGAMGD
jgi:hypothetical protein